MKRLVLLGTTAVFLVGCTVTPQPLTRDDMAAAVSREMNAMFSGPQQFSGTLDLNTAVERAVFNNLSSRVRSLESSYALSQMRVDSLDMLPSLAANAGYNSRDTDGYSTSQIFGQAAATGTYSRGSDESNTTSDLTVTWNVLDFALGYYAAQQSADRALIAQERERQATHDLIRRAQTAYWRAYAAERLHGQISAATRNAERALERIQAGEQNGSIPPATALSQRRTVLESLRQLEILAQEMNVARVELAQIINVAPGTPITFANEQMSIPRVSGSLSDLETMAFESNPELREQLYRERISASDVRSTVASMFPNIGISAGHNTSQDSFLLDQAWNQVGLNASFNLMRILTAPTLKGLAEEGREVEAARSLAVRMAVLAQTNIAYEQYRFARQQYGRARELYNVDRALAEQTSARREASVASGVEAVVADTSAVLSRLRLYQAYATLVDAHSAVNASVGNDTEISALQARLQSMQAEAEASLSTAEASITQLSQERAELDAQLRAATSEMNAAERALDRANRAMARADSRLSRANSAVQDGEATERQLARITTETAAAEAASADLVDAQSRVEALSTQISGIQAQIEQNQAAQENAEQDRAAAQQRIEFYGSI